MDELANLGLPIQEITTVEFLSGGTPVTRTFTGPLLYDVLQYAEPIFTSKNRNDQLRFYVAATGFDAYGELSGGERQLVLVARAIAQEPRILVLDEPTANLDFGNQVRVLSAIRALATRGLAIVFSTHDPDQAFLCAHRVALLHGGQLAALGAPPEVITPERLRVAYGIDVPVVAVDVGGTRRMTCLPSLGDGAGPHG